MKKLLMLICLISLTACVHSPKKTEISELENGQYQISAISEEHWSGDFLSAELFKNAEEFCLNQNKKFERLEIKKEDERRFNYSTASIVFKCL
jgi:lipoprotein